MITVLVVDDNENLLRMLQRTLSYEGFSVISAQDGRSALTAIEARKPNLVILDWMMPEVDGLSVVRHLRTRQDETPILMLTARDTIEERVQGLNSGADDYLVKPFAPEELLARVHALLRRTEIRRADNYRTDNHRTDNHRTGQPAQPTHPPRLVYADLTLDLASRESRRGARKFDLTPTEFELLHLLLRHPRQVLTRQQILEEVWGYDFAGEDNVLEVYIGYLRKKSEANGEPRLIHTARGVGYVLREE